MVQQPLWSVSSAEWQHHVGAPADLQQRTAVRVGVATLCKAASQLRNACLWSSHGYASAAVVTRKHGGVVACLQEESNLHGGDGERLAAWQDRVRQRIIPVVPSHHRVSVFC